MEHEDDWNHFKYATPGIVVGIFVGIAINEGYTHYIDHNHHQALEPQVQTDRAALKSAIGQARLDAKSVNIPLADLGNKLLSHSAHEQVMHDKQVLTAEIGSQNHNPNISGDVYGLMFGLPILLGALATKALLRRSNNRHQLRTAKA